MNAIQLEFNIDNKSPAEMEMQYMKQLLTEMNESMGKVRRKLFAEMSEMKRICLAVQKENECLKEMIQGNKEIEWDYNKPGYLFDVETKVVAFS